MHPNLNREIFVTWVFDVMISGPDEAVQSVTLAELSINPDTASCLDTVTLFGRDYPPRQPIHVTIHPIDEADSARDTLWGVPTRPETEDDGSFTLELPANDIYPGCHSSEGTAETRLRVTASTSERRTGPSMNVDGSVPIVAASAEILLQPGESVPSGEFEDDPRVKQAIAQVRDFLGDATAELTADSIEEVDGYTLVHLSRPVPGLDADDPVDDAFVVDVSHGSTFTAHIVSNRVLV